MNRAESFMGAPWDEVRKVDSFVIKEDFPADEPYHPEKRIRDAISPAMLVVAADGKEYLIVQKN